MNPEVSNIRVSVDLTNPGQFFAWCGLLELADRLSPSAEGWFGRRQFCISTDDPLKTLAALLEEVRAVKFEVLGLKIRMIMEVEHCAKVVKKTNQSLLVVSLFKTL